MFYIYEGFVDPERDILRGLLGLLAWCGGSRRITLHISSMSFVPFFCFVIFESVFYFPIVRQLPLDETRATVREGKEEKRGIAVGAIRCVSFARVIRPHAHIPRCGFSLSFQLFTDYHGSRREPIAVRRTRKLCTTT